MQKTAVVLINLGTPDSPSVKDVRKYLFEFLNDPRVIDIPALARFILVNLIIVPFRAPKSAKIYKELWVNNGLPDGRKGSPILYYGKSVQEKLQRSLGDSYDVYTCHEISKTPRLMMSFRISIKKIIQRLL